MNDIAWVLELRNEVLTPLFVAFTHIGSETISIAILALGYLCINKKLFRDISVLYCLTVLINVMLKQWFQVPRPGVDYLVAMNDGSFSFPSGHAQVAVVIWLSIAIYYKRAWVWWVCLTMMLGISVSRVYMGVHYPTDILVGSLVGMLTVVGYVSFRQTVYWGLFSRKKHLMILIFMGFLGAYYFHMMGHLNYFTAVAPGGLMGILLGHVLENKRVKYVIPRAYSKRISFGLFGLFTMFSLKVGLGSVAVISETMLGLFLMNFFLGVYVFYVLPLLFVTFAKMKMMKERPSIVS